MNGAGTNHLGVNLAFTKFLFVSPVGDDEAARTRLRAAASVIQRGFFNDFESEGRESVPQETIPMSKTAEWWLKHPLERHAYFYPSSNGNGPVKGHARSAHEGISTIYRRLYYNPDGVNRADEFDFITYFECAEEHLPTFDRVRQALRDPSQNPEWSFVIEGPEWRGRRVLRW